MLAERAADQVVNHGEILTLEANGPVPVYKDGHFKLEPEWVLIVLLALVYSGDITLTIGRETLDAGNIERAALLGLDALTDFRFYRRPQELPAAQWRLIFEALGLPPGLVVDPIPSKREDAVRQLQERVYAELNSTAELLNTVQNGINILGTSLFTDRRTMQVARDGFVAEVERPSVPLSSLDLLPALRRTKQFLESLAKYNTPGKLRNLSLTRDEIARDIEARNITRHTSETVKAISQLQPLTEYLGQALMALPNEEWRKEAEDELPACVEFHTQLLDSSPICPFCRFQPAHVVRQGSAASRLGQLEAELVLMLAHWEEALQSTLRSETAQESLSRMTIAERQVIEQYLATKDAPLPDDFVQIANRALRGIQKVSLDVNELLEALSAGGFPCTEEDLRKRFETLLQAKMRGHDARNTRLSIERTGDTQSDAQVTAVTAQVSGGNA